MRLVSWSFSNVRTAILVFVASDFPLANIGREQLWLQSSGTKKKNLDFVNSKILATKLAHKIKEITKSRLVGYINVYKNQLYKTSL